MYKQSPKKHDKDTANQNQVVCLLSCHGFWAQLEWLNLEFKFTATNFMSVAAKSSDLGDKMPGANLQTEGHADVPSQGTEDQWESEVSGSSPSHSLSWFLARRQPSGCPNTRYCLKINVTLTKELGAVSPPSHSLMAPLVKICCMMLGLASPKQWR